MKIKSFVPFVLALIFAQNAFAAGGSAPVNVIATSTPILTSGYTEIVTSTLRTVKAVTVYSTLNNPVEIAFGAPGAEVVQMIIPAAVTAGTVFPITITPQTRLSLIAVGGNASTGVLELNFIYN